MYQQPYRIRKRTGSAAIRRRGSNLSKSSQNSNNSRASSLAQNRKNYRNTPLPQQQNLYETEYINENQEIQPYPNNQFYNEHLENDGYEDDDEGYYQQIGQPGNTGYLDYDCCEEYSPEDEDFGYNSVRIGDKNLRTRNITGYQKQPDMYSSMRGIDPDTDAYFYPNPSNIIHPCKKKNFNFFFSKEKKKKQKSVG